MLIIPVRRTATKLTINDITALQMEEHNLKSDKETVCVELLQATEELQKLKANNEQKIFDLNGIYAKPVRYIVFSQLFFFLSISI